MKEWTDFVETTRVEYPRARIESAGDDDSVIRWFGDAAAEYRACMESVALNPNPDWASFRAKGPDALDYLHRRLSQDLRPLADQSGAHALQLDADGRMLAELLVYRDGESLELLSDRFNVEAIAITTDKFTLMDRVEIERTWATDTIISLVGRKADALIESLAGKPTANDWALIPTFQIAGISCRAMRDGRWTIPYYHLAVPKNRLAEVMTELERRCREMGGGLMGIDALEFLSIELGISRFGKDTNIGTIPLEASLDPAIGFDKGCYPGQEIIARIRNLGHPARQIVKLDVEGEHSVSAGAEIRVNGQAAGNVTSAMTLAGIGRTVAIGFVKWRFRDAASAAIISASGEIPATMKPISVERPDSRLKEIRSSLGS